MSALLTTACASDSRSSDGSTVADSTGIQIVSNDEPIWKTGDEWKVTPAPIKIIGGATDDRSDRLFKEINAAFVLNGGNVFVVDQSNQHVRIFGPSGELIRTAARAGDGPGELSLIWRTFRIAGDTIVITGQRRDITWFTGSGDLVKSFSPTDVVSTAYAIMLDGRFVAVPADRSGMTPPPSTPKTPNSRAKAYHQPFHLADRNGKSLKDLGYMEYSKRTGGAFELLYGAKRYHVARERYYVGYAEEYSINVFDNRGKLIRIVRRNVPSLPVTAAEEAAAREVRRQRVTKGTYDEEQIQFLEPATHHPFFSEILVDAQEHLWVREYRKHEDGIDRSKPQPREGGQAQRFNIFDRDGFWLGSVELPNQLQVTDIGRDYIAGIWRDADLLESVRVYGLARSTN